VSRNDPVAFRKIVVALHDREDIGDAMDKAAQLEHYTGAEILVVETCWDVVSEEPTQHFPQEEIDTIASRMKQTELNGLNALVAQFRARIADLQAEVIWAKHHDDAVARFALEVGADLIIAPHHPRSRLPGILLPEELKLAARARTPLLLTSGSPWQSQVNVLVALDVLDVRHHDLNERLIHVAGGLAGALGGELHLFTASPPLSTSVLPDQALVALKRESEQLRAAALADFAAAHPVDGATTHVRTGEVVQAIDEIVSAYGIAMVVIGSAARTALQRLFVGNTAESVLNQLVDTDIVMVPDPQHD